MKPKVYTNNIAIERVILGSVLLDNFSFNKIEGFIVEQDFYTIPHQIIFTTMSEMLNSNDVVDLETLSHCLLKKGKLEQVGGPPYLMDLLEATPTSQVITRYSEILKENSNQRKVIKYCQNTFDEWEKLNPENLMSGFEELMTGIQEDKQQKEIFIASDLQKQINEIHETGGLLTGVNTPWSNLSKICRFRKGLFTVITGAPSSGKSTILDNIILHLAETYEWRTVIFSPENYPLGFHISSFIEKYSGYPMKDQYNEKISIRAVETAMEFLSEYIIFLQPQKTPTIEKLFALTKTIMKKQKVDSLVIDPYNMLNHPRDTRTAETEYIGVFLRKIREFSRANGIHTFIVAHPRKLQKRRDGNFEVASAYDISSSANWFNAADYILSVWRDLIKTEEPTRVYVQKVKFKELGCPGHAKLKFNEVDGKFSDYFDQGAYPY